MKSNKKRIANKGLITPDHVALIPDGNRRWARLHRLQVWNGHSMGIKRFIEFASWAKQFGVKTVTVWALSTENIKNRPPLEVKVLMRLFLHAAKDKMFLKMLEENGASLRIIGDLNQLPKKLTDALRDVERKTAMYKELTINILINYGGKEDLVHSIQEITKEARRKNFRISEEEIGKRLRTASLPDVDLVVRTSGEQRLSGLLPWQAGYSELYFAKKYWPDFKKKDFKKAIETFSIRQRRFGK